MRFSMEQLLASQMLRTQEVLITDPLEQRVLRIIRDQRLTTTFCTKTWQTNSALLKVTVPEALLTFLPHCRDQSHDIRVTASAEVNGLSIWSKAYLKATRKNSSFFLCRAVDGKRHFVSVDSIWICRDCRSIWLFCRSYRPTFFGMCSQYAIDEQG